MQVNTLHKILYILRTSDPSANVQRRILYIVQELEQKQKQDYTNPDKCTPLLSYLNA